MGGVPERLVPDLLTKSSSFFSLSAQEVRLAAATMGDFDASLTQEPIKVYENTYIMKPEENQR